MFRGILVPLDGSTVAEQALPWAEVYASRGEGPVMLLTVKDLNTPGRARGHAAAVRHSHEYLQQVRKRLRNLGVQAVEIVLEGSPAEAIVATGVKAGCDLIIMTRRGLSSTRRWLLGSVTEKVVRLSSMPVLIVPEAGRRSLQVRSILVPLDGSNLSASVLPEAERLAAFHDCRLILCHVTPDGGFASSHDSINIQLGIDHWCRRAQRRGIWTSAHYARGDPASEVLDFAEKGSDLVALAAHGSGGFRRWLLGSVADKIIHHASVPILVLGANALDTSERPQAAARDSSSQHVTRAH